MSTKRLIKKYRLDEVKNWQFDMTIGLYVDPATSKFYALVPEKEGAKEHTADSLEALKPIVLAAIVDYEQLVWTEVIRVNYGHTRGWDPNDPSTASDRVGPLSLERVQIAVRANGDRAIRSMRAKPRSWKIGGKTEEEVWEADEQAVRVERGKYKTTSPWDDGVKEYAFDEALWQALQGFQEKIRQLDHTIRHFVAREDFTARLIEGTAPLAITDTKGPT